MCGVGPHVSKVPFPDLEAAVGVYPSGKDRDLGRSEASVYSQAHSFRYIKKNFAIAP
jgi:hypothetical protein